MYNTSAGLYYIQSYVNFRAIDVLQFELSAARCSWHFENPKYVYHVQQFNVVRSRFHIYF